ncbi:MAG: hypothetical protein WBE76_10800 [Terracidiphilus sp.]
MKNFRADDEFFERRKAAYQALVENLGAGQPAAPRKAEDSSKVGIAGHMAGARVSVNE